MAIAVRQTSLPDDSEWKSCLEQTNKFDGYLFDLRKYGFTLITGLITAGSFLGFESGTGLVQVGVIVVTMILVRVLFWIDEYYQKALTRIQARGRFVEITLNRGLISSLPNLKASGEMSSRHPSVSALYLGFTVALGALAFFAILTEANLLSIDRSSETPSTDTSQTATALTFAQFQRNSNYHFVQEEDVLPETAPNVTIILVYVGILIVSVVLAFNIYRSNEDLRKQQKKKNEDIDPLLKEYSEKIKTLNVDLSKKKENADNIKQNADRLHKQALERQKVVSDFLVKVLDRQQQYVDKRLFGEFEESALHLRMLEERLEGEEQMLRKELSDIQNLHSEIVDKAAQYENSVMEIIQRDEIIRP
jgi:hypothetical protein